MSEPQDYKLANLARQELKRREIRQAILASDDHRALDLILEAASPATLVQSFPDQDLYFLMHKVGVHDFLPVLAMASSDQWEYILDVEVWDEDRLDLHAMTQVFDLLYKADPKRLLRWGIMKKPEFMEFYLFHHLQVVVREHDEPPPADHEDYITLDDKFYFRFPDRNPGDPEEGELLPGQAPEEGLGHDEAPELIESMLKTLAEMDLSVFHGLLLETTALLPAEAEEEEFRLRTIRLAEKGFLPPHEAVGIYQPAGRPRKRPDRPQRDQDPDRPLPPQFFVQFIRGDLLFVQAMKIVQQRQSSDPDSRGPSLTDIHNELAALINKIIAADRIKIRKTRDIQEVMEKAGAYLSLGLDVLMGKSADPESAADLIETHFIQDIFRAGSREGIRLKNRAVDWYETSFVRGASLPLSFLGEAYLGVLGGLFIERPLFFADYADKQLYRQFRRLEDIRSTNRILEEIMELDRFLADLAPDLSTFTLGVLTYKSMILTLWARERTGLPGRSLAPIPTNRFVPFFADLFSGETPGQIPETRAKDLAEWAARAAGRRPGELSSPLQRLLFSLVQELEEEYGPVSAHKADPRFMPHFLLSGSGPGQAGDLFDGDSDPDNPAHD